MNLDNPKHVDATDTVEAWGLSFARGSAVYYLLTAAKSSTDTLEALRRAQWLINREIASLTPMPVAPKVPVWPMPVAPPATATSTPPVDPKPPELFDNLYSDAKNAGAAVATSTMLVVDKYKRGDPLTDAEMALYTLWAETNEPTVPAETSS